MNFFWWLICTFTSTPKEDFKKSYFWASSLFLLQACRTVAVVLDLGNKISESYWPHNPLQNDPTSLELMIDHQFSKVTMAIWVVKFSREGGIQNWKDFCLKINTPKGNYWILRIGIMGRCQKVPKFDFQSQFCMSKIIGIFLNFF